MELMNRQPKDLGGAVFSDWGFVSNPSTMAAKCIGADRQHSESFTSLGIGEISVLRSHEFQSMAPGAGLGGGAYARGANANKPAPKGVRQPSYPARFPSSKNPSLEIATGATDAATFQRRASC